MPRTIIAAALSAAIAAALAAAPGAAQQTGGSFALELNNAEGVEDGCRLTFVAENGLGTALDATSYEVAVFDGDGVVDRLLILEFGALDADKTKVVQFDLSDTTCPAISRILVNDVAECTAADGSEPACMDGLALSSRTDIQFDL